MRSEGLSTSGETLVAKNILPETARILRCSASRPATYRDEIESDHLIRGYSRSSAAQIF